MGWLFGVARGMVEGEGVKEDGGFVKGASGADFSFCDGESRCGDARG